MMKKKIKRLFTGEKLVLAVIILVFAFAAVGIALSVRNYVPPERAADSTVRYGKKEAYNETVRLIREEGESLLRMLELAKAMPGIRYIDAEAAGQRDSALAEMMREHGIEGIYRDKQMWVFDTRYSGGIVTSSTEYSILYTAADPRQLVTTWNDDAQWAQAGDGWAQADGNIAYLEEISENFYYFYLAT